MNNIASPVSSWWSLIVWPWLACTAFWLVFCACVVEPPADPPPPASRLVIGWDPLECGTPHRIVVELEDDDGAPIAASAPCWLGAVTLDAPRWGLYRGRIYTWVLDQPIRSVTKVTITVDAPIIRWQLATPP